MLRLLFLSALFALAAVCPASMHPTSIASARARVAVDGSVEVQIRFDVLAFVLDQVPSEVDDEEMRVLLHLATEPLEARLDEASRQFFAGLRILGDNGEGRVLAQAFPSAKDVIQWREANGEGKLPVMMAATVKARLPAGSKKISMRFAEVLDTVILTVELPYQEPLSDPVEVGESSRWITLPTRSQVDQAATAVAVNTRERSQEQRQRGAPPVSSEPPKRRQEESSSLASMFSALVDRAMKMAPEPTVSVARADWQPYEPPAATLIAERLPVLQEQASEPTPWFHSFPAYVRLGFVHIVPQGLDHILFVLGLFLLSTKWQDLLKQITAFTIAHSLTLGLAMVGLVRLPGYIVEPLIALSIVFIAIENLFAAKLTPWRMYVVFGFGLMHGLGFAGVLQDAGLAKANFLTALAGFNVGVELAQLAVVGGAALLVGWLRSSERYRALITVPASAAIGAVALVWTVERLL